MCSTPARNNLVGRRTRRVIRLGDQVTVQVAKVDTFKKQVDFRLAEDRKPAARPAAWRSFTRPPHGAPGRPARGRRRGK